MNLSTCATYPPLNAISPVEDAGSVEPAPRPTRIIPVRNGLVGNVCDIFRWENARDPAAIRLYHRHPFFELVWISAGGGTHFSDFDAHPFKAGSLVIVPVNQVHAWHYRADTRGFVLLIPACISLQIGRPLDTALVLPLRSEGLAPVVDVPASSWPTIDNLCGLIAQEHAEQRRHRDQVLRSLLDALIVECSRHLPAESQNESPAAHITQLFVEAVEKSFTNCHKVQDYARNLKIPEPVLTRSVRSRTGKRPREILQERLLLEAKRLLVHSTLTVAEVGYQLGFKTPSNFGRFFKTLTGKAPRRDYRNV